MRKLLTLTLIFINLQSFGQDLQIEKSALTFYLDSLYEPGTKVMSDGKIYRDKNPGVYYISYVTCLMPQERFRKRENNEVLDSLLIVHKGLDYKNIPFQQDTTSLRGLTLPINQPLIMKKKHKYQRLRGGIIGFFRNIGDSLVGDRYYLEIYRYITLDGQHYVKVSQTKKDLEYSKDFYLKIDKSGNVCDWCESGWIQ